MILSDVGEPNIFKQMIYLSALEHARTLTLSKYVLLGSINTIHKYYQHVILSIYVLIVFINTCTICMYVLLLLHASEKCIGMYIPEHGHHISALTHPTAFLLNENVLL